jgi:glycosyltransferase involved in cell wall biosynthesis
VARNRGLEEVRSEFVKFLDDDDWLAEGGLTAEVEVLRENEADVCYGRYQFVEDDGALIKEVEAETHTDYVAALLEGRILTHTLRFTYRRTFIEGAKWNPRIPARQDLAFAFTIGTRHPRAVALNEVVGYFRQHGEERVSTQAGERGNPSLRHAEILVDTIERLEERQELTGKRRAAAARGLWAWAYLLAVRNWPTFEKMYGLIQRIQPGFCPSRSIALLAALDEWKNPRATECLLYPVRKAKYLLGKQ